MMAACMPAGADVMDLFAVQDAELMNLGAANNNWGGLSYLVGNVSQAGGPTSTCPPPAGQVCFAYMSGDDRGLFKFDLSVLPEHSIIDSATVSLYVGFQGFLPQYSQHRIPSVSLYEVTSDWTEMGVTYNTKPTWDFTQVTSLPIPQGTGQGNNTPVNGYINGNLTSLVRDWYDGTTPNYGLMTSDTTNQYGLLRIYAHEATGTGSDPRLRITYHIEQPVSVPEPSSLLLLSSASMIAFVAARRWRLYAKR
jgi:hypothetical protein